MKRIIGLVGIIGALFLAPLVLMQCAGAVIPFIVSGDYGPALALVNSGFVSQCVLLDLTAVLTILGDVTEGNE